MFAPPETSVGVSFPAWTPGRRTRVGVNGQHGSDAQEPGL